MLLEIHHLRQDYTAGTLDAQTVDPDPLRQFEAWFKDALQAGEPEPNAMTLATATLDGKPSARIVLLKGLDPGGFVFYTNYDSRKGRELEANAHAALVFMWMTMQRQVRVEGIVEKVLPEVSTQYFQSRPKDSQIGAWASTQSAVISDRSILEAKVAALETQYAESDYLPRPEQWGGYLLRPTCIEFWQGRSSRLHDRVQYLSDNAGGWVIQRLAP
ncbi:MAG: pyridoxamine 5'-phosphate oxidase [Saprospiraceae bacterium]|nr:pyridoxamine 5'-phosphate oxidase [Saprospiraceae bacterium]